MCFNLGAGKTLGTTSYSGVTIKEQRETTLPSYYYTNAAGTAISSAYVAGQEVLWGDLFKQVELLMDIKVGFLQRFPIHL